MRRYRSSRSDFSSLAEARARVEVRVAIALGGEGSRFTGCQ
jgi:hypothetical protein